MKRRALHMKSEKRFCLVLCMLLLIAGTAARAGAQQERVPVTKKKVTIIIPDRNQPQRPVQITDKSEVNREPPIEPNSIRVRIRYQKEYGYITTKSFNDDGPYSCNAFAVDGGGWAGEPGTFRRPKTGNEHGRLM